MSTNIQVFISRASFKKGISKKCTIVKSFNLINEATSKNKVLDFFKEQQKKQAFPLYNELIGMIKLDLQFTASNNSFETS